MRYLCELSTYRYHWLFGLINDETKNELAFKQKDGYIFVNEELSYDFVKQKTKALKQHSARLLPWRAFAWLINYQNIFLDVMLLKSIASNPEQLHLHEDEFNQLFSNEIITILKPITQPKPSIFSRFVLACSNAVRGVSNWFRNTMTSDVFPQASNENHVNLFFSPAVNLEYDFDEEPDYEFDEELAFAIPIGWQQVNQLRAFGLNKQAGDTFTQSDCKKIKQVLMTAHPDKGGPQEQFKYYYPIYQHLEKWWKREFNILEHIEMTSAGKTLYSHTQLLKQKATRLGERAQELVDDSQMIIADADKLITDVDDLVRDYLQEKALDESGELTHDAQLFSNYLHQLTNSVEHPTNQALKLAPIAAKMATNGLKLVIDAEKLATNSGKFDSDAQVSAKDKQVLAKFDQLMAIFGKVLKIDLKLIHKDKEVFARTKQLLVKKNEQLARKNKELAINDIVLERVDAEGEKLGQEIKQLNARHGEIVTTMYAGGYTEEEYYRAFEVWEQQRDELEARNEKLAPDTYKAQHYGELASLVGNNPQTFFNAGVTKPDAEHSPNLTPSPQAQQSSSSSSSSANLQAQAVSL